MALFASSITLLSWVINSGMSVDPTPMRFIIDADGSLQAPRRDSHDGGYVDDDYSSTNLAATAANNFDYYDYYVYYYDAGSQLGASIPSAGEVDDSKLLGDAMAFWDLFYDPGTGLYADSISVNSNSGISSASKFSIASLGFGLLVSCVWEKLSGLGALTDLISRGDILDRAIKALSFVTKKSPRDQQSGFFCHWITTDKHEAIGDGSVPGAPVGSTIDSSIFIAGAVFITNYLNDSQVTALVNGFGSSSSRPFASVPTDRWVAEPISYGPHGLLVRPLWGALETPGKSVIYIYIYIDIKVQIEQWDWYSNVPVCRPHWVYRTTFRETHSQIPLDSHIFGSKPIA